VTTDEVELWPANGEGRIARSRFERLPPRNIYAPTLDCFLLPAPGSNLADVQDKLFVARRELHWLVTKTL
jgi:hypothetical protein